MQSVRDALFSSPLGDAPFREVPVPQPRPLDGVTSLPRPLDGDMPTHGPLAGFQLPALRPSKGTLFDASFAPITLLALAPVAMRDAEGMRRRMQSSEANAAGSTVTASSQAEAEETGEEETDGLEDAMGWEWRGLRRGYTKYSNNAPSVFRRAARGRPAQ